MSDREQDAWDCECGRRIYGDPDCVSHECEDDEDPTAGFLYEAFWN
jgi:hypothetical protein